MEPFLEGGHTIRPCQCMFRKGPPLSPWLHFGLHFGVILGAKFATILLFGRPGGRNSSTKNAVKKHAGKCDAEACEVMQEPGPGALKQSNIPDNQDSGTVGQ